MVGSTPVILRGAIVARNSRLIDVGIQAEQSVFGGSYTPDQSKAYLEFDICHSLPDYLGPVGMGPGVSNYCGFFGDTLEASHGSLVHQQLNLRHLLKCYGSEASPIHHDRIVGCIVATHMPRRPHNGWKVPGNTAGATCHIKCLAVVFKMASGVSKMVGDHLSEREPQSVSIEVRTQFQNLGLYIPSRDQSMPFHEPTEEVYRAMKMVKGSNVPLVGKVKTEAHPEGEQVIVTYGYGGKPVHFCGVGVTPTPAERTARIVRLNAEEGETISIAAESVMQTLVGRKVTFSTGRTGIIRQVHTSRCSTGPISRTGSPEDPVLEIRIQGERVLRHFSELAGKIE